MKKKDDLSVEIYTDGTAGISFYAANEHGNFVEIEGIGENRKQKFSNNDLEQAQKKGNHRQNIPIGENIRDAIRSIKGE